MARSRVHSPPYFVCETCGSQTIHLRRDVLDGNYNALDKTPFWNCDECYRKKRRDRMTRDDHQSVRSSS